MLCSLIAEGATSLAVVAAPARVARLLFDSSLDDAGITFARLLGLTLLCLVIACWPRANASGGTPAAFTAVFAYNLLAGLFLLYFAIASQQAGVLLWPAVAEHLLVALLLFKSALHGNVDVANPVMTKEREKPS